MVRRGDDATDGVVRMANEPAAARRTPTARCYRNGPSLMKARRTSVPRRQAPADRSSVHLSGAIAGMTDDRRRSEAAPADPRRGTANELLLVTVLVVVIVVVAGVVIAQLVVTLVHAVATDLAPAVYLK